MPGSDVFNQLVERSGLSSVFATNALRRVCERAGISPEALGRADLGKVLPEIQRTLSIYLGPDEAAIRARRIRELAA